MSYGNLLRIIQQQRDDIDSLTTRLTNLELAFKDEIKGKVHVVDLSVDLPLKLRKTVNILKSLNGKASAQEIADISKNCRAVESGYLNDLVRMKVLSKAHDSRKVYFFLSDKQG